jgi:D-inositol-3-phosphate glycosyltransferase
MALALRKARELGVIRARTVHAARSLEQRVGQRLLLVRADTWVVRSQSHARELLNGFRLDASRLHVIPGSVDSAVFAPADAAVRAAVRARFDIPDDALLVAQMALIAPGRGQEALVRAVAYMGDSPVHALFVGRGENEHAIRELARELGVSHRVHFAGYVGLPGLVDMYAAADVAFVARPGNDAASRGALEAMACGKPVMALREAALAETVTDRVGYPISAVSPDLVARAMRVILDDRADALLRGQTARELVVQARTFEREAKLTRDAYTVAGAAVQPRMLPIDA